MDSGKVWKIDAVVFSLPSTTRGHGKIDVYAIQVSDARRDDLESDWAAWIMPSESQETTTEPG
ncbi:MAG: hypothetical protein ACWGMZ_00800 [Thermoguttaceae bacterium]